MQVGRREVPLRARSQRKQGVIDVRTIGVAENPGPIVVFHHDNENRPDVGERVAPRRKHGRQENSPP